MRLLLATILGLALVPALVGAADGPSYTRTQDVVYGRKFGTALTFDVFTPREKAKGLGVLCVVSGGWYSAHEAIPIPLIEPIVARGYTVFAVVHGSQPRYTVPEVIEDLDRATHFIHYKAKDFKVDPDRLGIYGFSAGGHLSLMQATSGDLREIGLFDPASRTSSRVKAVVAFFPPTDFLNYDRPGDVALGTGLLRDYRAPFDFHEFDLKQHLFVPITEPTRIHEIGRAISPISHVSPDDPPTLLFHGDADRLVPIRQSQIMVEVLKGAGVEAKLVVKPGAAHGWADIAKDMPAVADWFDAHLAIPPK